METRAEIRALAFVALTVSPVVGWASMIAAWFVVHSEFSGGPDLGVVLVGATVSACLTLVCCHGAAVDKRAGARLTALSFSLTFGVALLALIGFAAWFDHMMAGLGKGD